MPRGRGPAATGAGPAAGRTSSAKQATNTGSKRKRLSSTIEDDDDESDDDQGDGEEEAGQGGRKKKKLKTGVDKGSKLACPFFKHNPEIYGKNICAKGTWPDIARLKEHLQRAHMQPEGLCFRCGDDFGSLDALQDHQRGAARCDLNEECPGLLYIDMKKLSLLGRSRSRPQKSLDEKWKEIYTTLFPNHHPIPSPYHTYPMGAFEESVLQLIQQAELTKDEEDRFLPHLREAIEKLKGRYHVPITLSEPRNSNGGPQPYEDISSTHQPCRLNVTQGVQGAAVSFNNLPTPAGAYSQSPASHPSPYPSCGHHANGSASYSPVWPQGAHPEQGMIANGYYTPEITGNQPLSSNYDPSTHHAGPDMQAFAAGQNNNAGPRYITPMSQMSPAGMQRQPSQESCYLMQGDQNNRAWSLSHSPETRAMAAMQSLGGDQPGGTPRNDTPDPVWICNGNENNFRGMTPRYEYGADGAT